MPSCQRHSKFSPSLILSGRTLVACLLFLVGLAAQVQAAITFVQQNSSDPQAPQTSVTVPYTLAQTAGNLNVVIVGWNDSTATVSSVSDTSGNLYSPALIPTVQSGTASLVIYYAKNIASSAAGANSVTVTFASAANFPDIRIAEYSGLDPANPLDVAVGAQGSSATSSSGAVTTTNANDLLVGANLVQTLTTGPGSGYTNRVITNPDGDILEDRVVTTIGSYTATAPVSPSGQWVMQIVAFRAAAGGVGVATTLTATAGTAQSATVGNAFATQLQATVKDSLGNPVSGVTVTFAAPGSGASGTFAGGTNTATTNAQGVATAAIFTANSVAGGPYNVSATVPGVSTPANFSLTNLAGPAASIAATAGTPQSAPINTAFASALQATVRDAGGNPVSGVNVTFTAPVSGASGLFSNSTATITVATNASGVASAAFTANGTAGGPYTVTAAATGLTAVNFSLTNTAAPPSTMTANVGTTPQSAMINTAFANALAVTVKDAGGTAVSGVNVTFTAPGTGAAGVFGNSTATITVATDTSGIASAAFTANATAGGPYTVTAAATGLTTVNFSLTNLTGAASTMTANAGTTPQSATISTAFANALAVTVKDAVGNPVSGVNVTFTAPALGASGLFSNSTGTITLPTNTSGIASAAITANATAGGPYTVTAAATGLTTVNFSLTNLSAGGPISLVQHTSKDAGTTTSSTLAFASANTAGNFIAVVIRAGKTGQVFTVTDSRGNSYHKAIQFNETIDSTTLGIFYAESIASGTNTITVSDTISGTLRFGILEYSGIATANSLDGAAVSSQGTGTSLNSGILTTSSSGDLVLGGMSTANAANFTAGSGYVARDFVPAEPNTKLLVEDRIQSVAGNISANASLGASDNWGAVAAAFRSGAAVPPPTFTPPSNLTAAASGPVQVNLSWTAATETGGTLTGYLIERCTGAACSNFAQVGNSATTAYSDTSASLTGSTTYNYRVRATDGTNFSGYSNTAPATTAPPTFTAPSNLTATAAGNAQLNLSWTPATETGGTLTNYLVERCAGANCANTLSNFAQIATSTTTSFNDTGLTVSTPYSYRVRATDGTNFSAYSNVATGTPVLGPGLSTLSLTQGPVGASITITGSGFGGSRGSSTITFNGTPVTLVTSWTDTSIDTSVPAGATTGNVVVTVGGIQSNALPFAVTPPPNITGVNPNAGPIGTSVNVTGTNFGPTVGTRASGLLFNGVVARTTSWSDTLIVAPVPAGATSGNVIVSVGGINSNGVSYTVTPGPNIASLSPTSGAVGTLVSISGAGFGAPQGTSTITFNGVAATPTSWSDTSIVVPVPTGATTGNVVVTNGGSGISSNGIPFTVNAATSIQIVQHAGFDAGTTTSAFLPFMSPNTAGNFIAVVIRAGQSGQLFTVSDSRGNTYRKAITLGLTQDSQTIGIYYAEFIAGGANTVTVSDTISGTLRFAILEYSGVAVTNSLDAVAASQGNSKTPSSGNVTTSLSGDLLLGEITTANLQTFIAGTGFTIEQSVPAAANTKLIVEDEIQASIGSAAATATLFAADGWGAAIAAFKSASGAPPPPISVSVSPTSASVGAGSGSQNFTATAQNDFQNKGVTWSLSGAGCSGSTCGSLTNVTTTSVTYIGPANVPSPATVTLTATSISDNTKTASATITVIPGSLSVSVSPKRAAVTMSASQTVQLTAVVANDPSNSGVVWSVDNNNGGTAASGTVSATGLYTPGTQPGVHIVTATSVANAAVSASSTVAVTDLAGVYMHHNDLQRTGQNLQEYALTPATVSTPAFTKLFSCPTDGYVYAQPLWVANLTVGGVTRNVLFLATEHDSVYAYDADSSSCILLWKTSFLVGTTVTTMSWGDTVNNTNDIYPEIGITSTPVIDPATKTIYVVAKTKETIGTGCSTASPCYISRLHALDITTGAEKFGGPVVISAANFDSRRHFNRPALLLNNGTVYVALGSHADGCNWQGWLFAYDAATLAQTFIWTTSDPTSGCNGAAIWDGGAGPAADASGNIYFVTGNGSYDGVKNFSESTIKLSPTGALLDWFTPFNRSVLDANDVDMGSAGIIILPDAVASAAHPHLGLATGKVAVLYLLDISQAAPGQTKMGKFNSTTNNDVQEVIPVPPPNTTQLDGGNYSVPAYWNGNIYTTGQNFPLSQFTISNGVIATPQLASSGNLFPPRGGVPAVSASGTTNGVVWVIDYTAWATSGPSILDGYDATNVGTLLYSSPSSGTGAAGPSVKFTVPTVANGKVYVGGQSTVTVFGLLPN